MQGMGTLKAVVRDGRLILDEPTELPEGTVVELAELAGASDGRSTRLEDLVPPEDLSRFRAELQESSEQALRGELIPVEEILDEL
jgi:DNA-binding MurR/RpiR family transcriptional regulator